MSTPPLDGTYYIINTKTIQLLASTPAQLLQARYNYNRFSTPGNGAPVANNAADGAVELPQDHFNPFLHDNDIFDASRVATPEEADGIYTFAITQTSIQFGQVKVKWDAEEKDWVIQSLDDLHLALDRRDSIVPEQDVTTIAAPEGANEAEISSLASATPRWVLLQTREVVPTDRSPDLSTEMINYAVTAPFPETTATTTTTADSATISATIQDEFKDPVEYVANPYEITLHDAHTLTTISADARRAMKFLPGLDKIVNWIRGVLDQAQDHIHIGGIAVAAINMFKHLSVHWGTWTAFKKLIEYIFGPAVEYEPGTKTEIPEVPNCLVYKQSKVENWGNTVSTLADFVFVPQSVQNIKDIVSYAKEQKKSIRCSGYTHTWAPVYCNPDQISVAFIPPAMTRPETWTNDVHSGVDITDELHSIQWEKVKVVDDGKFALLRVGAGARNLDFLQGCHERQFQYTIPFNVIMTEITFGGSTSMICHGAGKTSTTVSDLVHTIELIDFDGNQRILTRSNPEDAELMNSATGGFGLFGIITHLTLKLPKMSIARYSPYNIDAQLAIPSPLSDAQNLPGFTEALERFKGDINKYYCEWFWFPFQPNIWVNCYDTVPIEFPTQINDFDPVEVVAAKNRAQQKIEDLYDRNIVTYSHRFYGNMTACGVGFSQFFIPDCNECAKCFGAFAGCALPTFKQTFPTADRAVRETQQTKDVILIEAVHFRRGIHSMPVRDMEAEIRLPDPDANGNDDKALNMLRELWWAGIDLANQYGKGDKKGAPLTMALEMRITGNAGATLAAQSGNNRTASIEVLSLKCVEEEVFKEYCILLWNKWEEIAIKYLQDKNCVRPHWAKEWGFLVERAGLNLTEMYDLQFKKFIEDLNRYAGHNNSGRTAKDYFEFFGNDQLTDLFRGFV